MASPSAAFLALAFLFPLVACGGGSAPSATPSQGAAATVPAVTADPTILASLGAATGSEPSADVGADLVLAYGCLACHSTDGSELVGPTWQGLYGTQEELENGSTILVDDSYITESIKAPNAKITRGFTAGLMPATLGVKDEEIPHIIEYIKSLK